MSTVKFQKQSEEWLMFKEFWELCQQFWIPESNDTYWELLVSEINKFHEKYQHMKLAKELALSFVDAQERAFEETKRK